MDGNKKNKFFKGLRGREKEEQMAAVPEGEIQETLEAGSDDADAEAEALKEEIAERNELDVIYQLYCKWCQYNAKRPMEDLFSKWMKQPVVEESLPGFEEAPDLAEVFSKQLLLVANKILRQIKNAEDKAAVEDGVKINLPEIDAAVHIHIPRGNMIAFIFVFPPFGGGRALNKFALEDALQKAGVTQGIRKDVIRKIAEQQSFFRIFTIATGVLPIAGEDGKVIEHIPREQDSSFKEDESGRVDYKSLNLFRNIKNEELICDIIPPGEGTDGVDIKGAAVQAENGKTPFVPAGNNTVISPDGRQLLASSDGFISFQQGRFRIENQLVIPGDVDTSVGNQDFLGDIVVYGDVISGFSLKATGNIHVKGLVEGAILTAGEDIEIGDGMNGHDQGELHAGKSIKTAFLENVKAYASEDIHVQSMVSCEVFCNGSIYVDKGIGVIIGGRIMAGGALAAKIIGSKARRKTEVLLGVLPQKRTDQDENQKELDSVRETKNLLEKNIAYLKSAGNLPAGKAAVLAKLIEQEAEYSRKESELQIKLTEYENQTNDYSQCFVNCGTVYPPTKVTIGGEVYSVETVTTNCKLYLSEDGAIVLGAAE